VMFKPQGAGNCALGFNTLKSKIVIEFSD